MGLQNISYFGRESNICMHLFRLLVTPTNANTILNNKLKEHKMGVFSKLFGKKQDTHKSEALNETSQKLNIETSQTSEKFLYLTDEILGFLIGKLQTINTLEQEIFERSETLKNPEEPNQLQPGEKELWAEYAHRRKEITVPISMKQSEEGSRSFGKPTKYEYLTYPDTSIMFIMKSAKRAVVETQYEYGIKRKEQFVLKKDGDSWKIDTKKYGYPDEDTWYKDEL